MDYAPADVEEALREAIWECEREPRTSLWLSFWDRLTQGGGPFPDLPERERER